MAGLLLALQLVNEINLPFSTCFLFALHFAELICPWWCPNFL